MDGRLRRACTLASAAGVVLSIAGTALAATDDDDAYVSQSLQLELFQFHNHDGDAVASFVIMNSGDRVVLSVTLGCRYFEPVLRKLVPLDAVEIGSIGAHRMQQFGSVRLGNVGPLVEQVRCNIDKATIGAK